MAGDGRRWQEMAGDGREADTCSGHAKQSASFIEPPF